MSIKYIKKSIDQKTRSEDNEKVKKIVEETLKKIETNGDQHIRELSEKFDSYSPKNFKLTESEIEDLINEVSDEDVSELTEEPEEDPLPAQEGVDSESDTPVEPQDEAETDSGETKQTTLFGGDY